MSRLQGVVVVGALLAWMAGSAVGAATINVPLGGSIQTAIATANGGDVIVLAAGTYKECIDYSGKNLTIRGQGVTTILDGTGFNATVVTFQSGETSSARLEKVTVTGGSVTGGWAGGIAIYGASPTIWNCSITANYNGRGGNGGGIGIYGGSPAISSCAISGNYAENHGGGIYSDSGNPWINGCMIDGNQAGGGGGVAIEGGTFTLQNSRLASNGSAYGGGLWVWNGQGAVSNCAVESNTPNNGSTADAGGGAYEVNSVVNYSGNLFKNNSSSRGGGIYMEDTADGGGGVGSQVHNNLFVGNSASEGGALCTNIVNSLTNISTYVRNNTFYNNSSATNSGAVSVSGQPGGTQFANNIVSNTQGGTGIYDVDGYISMYYNCFWNNALGSYGGNASEHQTGTDLSVNPRFVNPAAGDFHLQSNNAHWHRIGALVWNTAGHWAKDNYTSPCIDAGAPTSDFSNEPAPNGGRVNMGRYGNTAEASKTSYWKTHTPSVCGVNVSRVQTISLEFLQPMNQASVESHLSVYYGKGNGVPGTITWPVANRRLEFTPADPLLASKTYSVQITSGTLLQSGGALDWNEWFYYTTGSGPAPTAWTPTGTGVARDTNISVTFDADMNQASVQAGFRTVPATTGTFSWVDRTMTYNPNGLLRANCVYTYTVDRSSQTTGGTKLGAGFNRSFTTGSTPTTAAVAMVGAASTVSGITSVTISLTAEAAVSASILNLAGREVAVLPSRSYEAGLQTLLWDGRSLAGTRVPGGRYLIRLEANTDDGQRASCLIPLQR